ncbi:MAG: COG4223 family protein [Gemmobacter sp.]
MAQPRTPKSGKARDPGKDLDPAGEEATQDPGPADDTRFEPQAMGDDPSQVTGPDTDTAPPEPADQMAADSPMAADAPDTSSPVPQAEGPSPVVVPAEETAPHPGVWVQSAPHDAPQAPEAETREAPPLPPPPPPAPRRASPILPVLGGIVAAAIGFGLAQVVPQGWPLAGIDGLQTRVTTQEATLARLGAEIEATRAAIPAIPVMPEPQAPDLSGIEARLEALEAALRDLAARPVPADPAVALTALEARIATLESLPPGAGEGADPEALSGLLRDLASLRAEVEGQRAAQAQAQADIAAMAEAARRAMAQAEAEAARNRATAEAEAARLAAEAEVVARATLLRAAAARVLAAVDSGASFAQPLDELVAGGIAAPEVLARASGGLPTMLSLQAGFADPARAALEAALRAEMGSEPLDRLGSFLRSATGARSLTPREGSDPDAVLSRAEGYLRAGDLAAALAELEGLPEAGQAEMAAWMAAARLRLEAAEAARALMAQVEG